jgi:hypothetical protein
LAHAGIEWISRYLMRNRGQSLEEGIKFNKVIQNENIVHAPTLCNRLYTYNRRIHNTFKNHEGDIIKFMADGRDNVSMQPVPMSNVRSKRLDRTYKVVAHTTETQTRSTSLSNYGYH